MRRCLITCGPLVRAKLVGKNAQKLEETKVKRAEAKTEYEASIRNLNLTESRVHEKLRKVLR